MRNCNIEFYFSYPSQNFSSVYFLELLSTEWVWEPLSTKAVSFSWAVLLALFSDMFTYIGNLMESTRTGTGYKINIQTWIVILYRSDLRLTFSKNPALFTIAQKRENKINSEKIWATLLTLKTPKHCWGKLKIQKHREI